MAKHLESQVHQIQNGSKSCTGKLFSVAIYGQKIGKSDVGDTSDIKPDNVFLDDVDTDQQAIYPFYPKPVLADFGLAFKTSPGDPNNPRFYNNGAGTEGYRAPEQYRWVDQQTLEPRFDDWKVDGKADVFAVGMLLRSLLLQRQDYNQPFFLGDGDADTSLHVVGLPAAGYYSIPLQTMVQDCLHFRPQRRLTFDALLRRIHSYTDEATHNLAAGMRTGSAGLVGQLRQGLLLTDIYQLGLSRLPPTLLPPPAL